MKFIRLTLDQLYHLVDGFENVKGQTQIRLLFDISTGQLNIVKDNPETIFAPSQNDQIELFPYTPGEISELIEVYRYLIQDQELIKRWKSIPHGQLDYIRLIKILAQKPSWLSNWARFFWKECINNILEQFELKKLSVIIEAFTPAPPRRQMRITIHNWKELIDSYNINLPDFSLYLDLETGRRISRDERNEFLNLEYSKPKELGVEEFQLEEALESRDMSRFVLLDAPESDENFRMIENFIEDLDIPLLKTQLKKMSKGKGVFRRFKDIVQSNGEWAEKWYEYEHKTHETRLLEKLNENHIEVILIPE
jgi:hypothetical protein